MVSVLSLLSILSQLANSTDVPNNVNSISASVEVQSTYAIPSLLVNDSNGAIPDEITAFTYTATPEFKGNTAAATLPNEVFNEPENQRVVLQITSSQELESRVDILRTATSLWIELSLNSFLDWENAFVIPHAKNIAGLIIRGPIYLDCVLQMLKQAINLKVLHMHNFRNEICEFNDGQQLQQQTMAKIVMKELKMLILEEFGTCTEVYNAIVTKLEMKKLEGLLIKAGNINSKNYPYIQALFQRTSNSLTYLSLHQSQISIDTSKAIFDSRYVRLLRLDYLHIDFLSKKNISRVQFLGPAFHGFAPNLTILTSDNGALSWSQMKYLTASKKIRNLKIATKIHNSRSYFNASYLRQFPDLQDVKLGLYREKCNRNHSDIPYLKIEDTKFLLKKGTKFEFHSNCKLKDGNPDNPNPKIDMINGMYVMKLGDST